MSMQTNPSVSRLNPQQRAAVRHMDGPLLVLAGAGSGKTRVITYKIVHLIDAGVAADRITAVTFTNKAAREMQDRVRALLQTNPCKGLTISTFHALGMNILRRDGRHLGFKRGFSIFDSQDSSQLLDNLVRKSRLRIDAGITRHQISSWKNDLTTPRYAIETAEDDHGLAMAQLYAEYQRHLKAYNTVDFDDLILQPVQLLRTNEAVLAHWQSKIHYLLVDEYQDTNLAQYELVKVIVGDAAHLTVVGDDDQSIYAWRGARPDNLERLKVDYPDLTIIKLEQNYRSTGCILRCANELISRNPHVLTKRLWSELGYGSATRIIACKDPDHEAARVVSELLHHRFMSRMREGDYAILYRGNHQSRPFERVLREHGISYHMSGGLSFFEYSEIKDILAYLRLLVNALDDQAFLRIVNIPRRELGAVTLEKLGQFAARHELGLLTASLDPALGGYLPARSQKRLREFAEWVAKHGNRAKGCEPVETVTDLLVDIRYRQWLEDTSPNPDDAARRWQNVEDLVAWLTHMAQQSDVGLTLCELVNRLRLMDILDRDRGKAEDNAVHLMTLHAAKGLEFPYVFLVGMEEDILPHRSSVADEAIEEERRLAYVGITRAQKALTVSFANRRKRGGTWQHCEPSRFLSELPEDDVEWINDKETTDPVERQTRGRAHLENLRDLLS
jgi:ATP-dependent DNA helicase Rep